MPRNITLSYYPWITQSISGADLRRAVQSFVDVLGAALGRILGEQLEVRLLPELDVSDQIEAIRETPASTGHASIALMNPIAYALTHVEVPSVESVGVVRRRIGQSPPGPTYKAQIYVNANANIAGLAALRKQSFAFGSPQSTSNFLVPAHMLWRSGLHPMNGFSRLEFAGGHDTAARAVYEGRVVAGAGHDGVILDLASRPGFEDAAQRLQRLAWSEPIPSDPIVLHAGDTDFGRALVGALSAIAPVDDPQAPGNLAVKAFWGTSEGIQPIAPDGYQSLLAYVDDLRLRPADLLRRW